MERRRGHRPHRKLRLRDVFSQDLAAELLEHTSINDCPIGLLDDKQPPYGPIYSIGPVELETLKTYLARTQVSTRHSGIHRIYQFLSAFHPGR